MKKLRLIRRKGIEDVLSRKDFRSLSDSVEGITWELNNNGTVDDVIFQGNGICYWIKKLEKMEEAMG